MTTRLVIIGGGPAGHSCASTAARLGADVVVIERDTIGGAAHLWDCIPSKAMIATGNARQFLRRSARMGLVEVGSDVDLDQRRDRLKHIESRLETTVRGLLDSQRVELVDRFGRVVDAHTLVATLPDGTERTFHADMVVLSTGSRPRIPEWAPVDGERVLSTRDAYPPWVMPEHVIVIGSGVTGVEFVHMFESMGAQVTLIVSRQQVLSRKGPRGCCCARGGLSPARREALQRCSSRVDCSGRQRGDRLLRRWPQGPGDQGPVCDACEGADQR